MKQKDISGGEKRKLFSDLVDKLNDYQDVFIETQQTIFGIFDRFKDLFGMVKNKV